MVTVLTRVIPHPAPHVTTGFESLLGCIPGEAGLAYSIINSQLKRRVAVGQWKPKT